MLTAQNNQPVGSGQAPSVAEPEAEQENDVSVAIDQDLQSTIDNLADDVKPQSAIIPTTLSPTTTIPQTDSGVVPITPIDLSNAQAPLDSAGMAKPIEIKNDPLNISEEVPQLSVVEPAVTTSVSIPSTMTVSPPTTNTETVIPDPIKTGVAVPLPGENAVPIVPVTSDANATFSNTNSFFDILVKNKIITAEQTEEVRQENLSSGKTLESLLIEKNLANETEVTQAKAEFNHIPYIKLSTTGVNPEALNLIDESIAKRYRVLPFGLDKDTKQLKVAMANPLDLAAIEFLRLKSGFNIDVYYGEESEVARMTVDRYAQSLSSEVTEALKTTNQYQSQQADGVELS